MDNASRPLFATEVFQKEGHAPKEPLDDSPFIRCFLRRVWIHGVIAEVQSQSLYKTEEPSDIDSYLGDEPKQLQHTTVMYGLRITELPDATGMSGARAVVVNVYGVYPLFSIGDEVVIKAKRYVFLRKITAKRIYDLTTHQELAPEIQVPAGLVKLPAKIALWFFLLLMIAGLILSGGAATLLAIVGVLVGLGLLFALPIRGIRAFKMKRKELKPSCFGIGNGRIK